MRGFEDSKEVKVATGGFLLNAMAQQDKKASWNREQINSMLRSIGTKLLKHGFRRVTGRVTGYANTTGAKTYKSKTNSLKISIAPFKIAPGYYWLAISSNFYAGRIPYDICLSKRHGKKVINDIIGNYCRFGKLTEEELNAVKRRMESY